MCYTTCCIHTSSPVLYTSLLPIRLDLIYWLGFALDALLRAADCARYCRSAEDNASSRDRATMVRRSHTVQSHVNHVEILCRRPPPAANSRLDSGASCGGKRSLLDWGWLGRFWTNDWQKSSLPYRNTSQTISEALFVFAAQNRHRGAPGYSGCIHFRG